MPNDAFAALHFAGEEEHTSPDYRLDNRKRGSMDHLILQRTVRGSGFFENARGRQLVEPGRVMLFTLNEPSVYGYPPELNGAPYRLRFLSLTPVPSVAPLFRQLREEFGSVLPMPDGLASDALFNEIFSRYKQRSFNDRFHEAELIYRLLLAIYREQVNETHTSDPIEYGYHLIRSHFRSPLNLKVIAQKCGVSREHFIRRFGERFNEPPGALLRRLRLNHAEAMLKATKLTVEEVALASGFLSANTLTRAYRVKFGHSPRRPADGS